MSFATEKLYFRIGTNVPFMTWRKTQEPPLKKAHIEIDDEMNNDGTVL